MVPEQRTCTYKVCQHGARATPAPCCYKVCHMVPEQRTCCYKVCHMVPEQRTCSYKVCHMVPEQRTKTCCYKVCHMVPEQRTCCYKVCHMVPEQRTRTCCYKVCHMVPETADLLLQGLQDGARAAHEDRVLHGVQAGVRPEDGQVLQVRAAVSAYTVTRCVPRCVCKQVPVCVCCPSCGCGGCDNGCVVCGNGGCGNGCGDGGCGDGGWVVAMPRWLRRDGRRSALRLNRPPGSRR